MPRHYGIGVIYDASKRADPFYDANFAPAILTGNAYRMDGARSDIYARFDQMVWRPDPDSPRGLSIFGVALQHTSGRAEQEHSFELGALQLGTFPGRDRDTIGFMVNEKRFSSLFVNNILAAHTMNGSTASVPREEVMFELNYGLEVNKAMRLLPNLQYVLNPDQQAEPFRPQAYPQRLRRWWPVRGGSDLAGLRGVGTGSTVDTFVIPERRRRTRNRCASTTKIGAHRFLDLRSRFVRNDDVVQDCPLRSL